MIYASDWLAHRSKLTPDKIALIDTINNDCEISYREWNLRVNQTAHYLTGHCGVQKGDRVAVLAMNSVEYLDIWFACAKLGAILQNLNWRLAVPELELLMKDARPQVLLYSDHFHDAIERLELRHDISSIHHVVALNKAIAEHHSLFSERAKYKTENFPQPELTHDDPWIICYTGGTTGLPKGAIITHGNITWNAINTISSWGVNHTDVSILSTPLFHTGGLNVTTAPLVYCGGTTIVCESFDANQVFDLMEKYKPTIFFGVPTMHSMIQAHPRWEQADFSGLSILLSGGAPCPDAIYNNYWKRGFLFKSGYGLTEAGPNTFWLPRDQIQAKAGRVGYPLMEIEIKLIDATGKKITEPNLPGELLIRGPHRTPGYWNNPGATEEAIDADGWFHTGDLAEFDADGCYAIVGRAKEMYISGGENVYPAEVENVLHELDAIAEAGVIGVHNEKWGEVGIAFVSFKAGATLSDDEILTHLNNRLAKYKVPKEIRIMDSLPHTGAGKINKVELREQCK